MASASVPWGCTPTPSNPYCSGSPSNTSTAPSSSTSASSSKHGVVTVALVVSSFILAALVLAGSVGLIAFRIYNRRREARRLADREAAAAAAEAQGKQEWEPGLVTIPTVVIHPDLEVHVAFQLDENSQPVKRLLPSWPSCQQLGSVPAGAAEARAAGAAAPAAAAVESGHAACPENSEVGSAFPSSGTSSTSWRGAGSEPSGDVSGSRDDARRPGATRSLELLVVTIDGP